MIHIALLTLPLLPILLAITLFHEPSSWSGWGGNIHNTRHSPSPHINSRNIAHVSTHCQIQYAKGVSATPVISGNIAYYPTWNGLFVALDYRSCKEKWNVSITSIIEANKPKTAIPEIAALILAISRTSPQIDEENGILYLGTSRYALVVALDPESGSPLGAININPHPAAVITQSPTLYDGILFIGSSSSESAAAARIPGYQCCTFVGNFVALRFDRRKREFKVLWDIPMIPKEMSGVGKWSGIAIWGSQPSIDEGRALVFVATGNLYTTLESHERCRNESKEMEVDECLPEEIWMDSVLAIDIDSGDVEWVRQVPSLDAEEARPAIATSDADFGMAPAFVKAEYGVETPGGRDLVVLGQKNGNLYAFDAETGDTAWAMKAGPGGELGGLSWGVAVDGHKVYYTLLNSENQAWELESTGRMTNSSFYGAVDLESGDVVWEAVARGEGVAYGPPNVVGDVVLQNAPVRGSNEQQGAVVVLEKHTGRVVKRVTTDGPVHGGVAVQERRILFGTGYQGYNGTGSMYVMKVW